MQSVLVVLPQWRFGNEDSPLRQSLPGLSHLAERAEILKLADIPPVASIEALEIGLSPQEANIAPGVLTTAALAEPPKRTTQFCLTLCSFVDGRLAPLTVQVPPEELRTVMATAQRLNTKVLTLVEGEQTENALVLEGWHGFNTYSPDEAKEKTLQEALPEGDAERQLRQYIDDSINLLSELPLNHERIDQGLPPLNLLWPWGQGIPPELPNLTLQRGQTIDVLSNSLRWRGLARLVRYRSAGCEEGLRQTGVHPMKKLSAGASFVWPLENFDRFELEEAHWLMRKLDETFFQLLADFMKETPTALTILAPENGTGIALRVTSGSPSTNGIPFDERIYDESRVQKVDLWKVADSALSA